MSYITTEQLTDAVKRTANSYLSMAVRLRQAGDRVNSDECYEDAEKLFSLIEDKNADIVFNLARNVNAVIDESLKTKMAEFVEQIKLETYG